MEYGFSKEANKVRFSSYTNLLALSIILIGLVTSCETESVGEAPNGAIIEVSSGRFTKRVLIEEITGTWCGFCPDAHLKIASILERYPDKACVVSYSVGDRQNISGTSDLTDELGGYLGVPAAAIDRFSRLDAVFSIYRNRWDSWVADALQIETAAVGVRISSEVVLREFPFGDLLRVEIWVAFAEDFHEPLALTAILIRDGIKQDQSNYYNDLMSSPLYQLGDPIPDYELHDTARQFLTSPTGNLIESSATIIGKGELLTFELDPLDDHESVRIVAFVHAVEDNEMQGRPVLNVRQSAIGEQQQWQ